MKSAELYNTSTTTNTITQLEYVTKKRDMTYISYLIIIIRTTAFKTNL